jgi:hypothetical protein
MHDQTPNHFTVDRSPFSSWYGTTNPYPQPLLTAEHIRYEASRSGMRLAFLILFLLGKISTLPLEPHYMRSSQALATSSTAPNGYFDPHNTGWLPPSICQERAAASGHVVQKQLDMQCEPAVAFDGPSSSCHQPPHISYSDSERSQFYDRIAATGTEPPHNVSQHHSLAYTYLVDHLPQSMYDQSLTASHPSRSIHPSYEERLAYQTLTPDLDAQGYEHYASFDAAESYRSSAAMEDIHQPPPPAFNSSSSSLAGACPINHLPCLSLGPTPSSTQPRASTLVRVTVSITTNTVTRTRRSRPRLHSPRKRAPR